MVYVCCVDLHNKRCRENVLRVLPATNHHPHSQFKWVPDDLYGTDGERAVAIPAANSSDLYVSGAAQYLERDNGTGTIYENLYLTQMPQRIRLPAERNGTFQDEDFYVRYVICPKILRIEFLSLYSVFSRIPEIGIRGGTFFKVYGVSGKGLHLQYSGSNLTLCGFLCQLCDSYPVADTENRNETSSRGLCMLIQRSDLGPSQRTDGTIPVEVSWRGWSSQVNVAGLAVSYWARRGQQLPKKSGWR